MPNIPDDELDGCELDFTDNPVADEDVATLVMFADVFHSEVKTERRRQDLVEWSAAVAAAEAGAAGAGGDDV